MVIEQIYTDCLAEAAYYIESEGEAAIIDPLRETDQYVQMAKGRNATIKYVFETHFHADFVSGHLDLAKKTGATIVYGPKAETGYQIHSAQDEEEFIIGKLTIRVLHTPGHTPESSTYLLFDENGREHAVFTGDTLFIGDVGRPDLAIKSDLTREDLAGMLYESLNKKIKPLADHVIVYPAHGAGSSCGKNMSEDTYDTLGNQKRTNYALQASTKEEFVKLVTEGILPAPQYFAKDALINKNGYVSYDEVMQKAVPLSVEELKQHQANGALVIDTRSMTDFADGFIPNSIFVGLDGMFAIWVGTLVKDINQPIIIISDQGKHQEVITRLSRVGYDNAIGYLENGYSTWLQAGEPTCKLDHISAEQLKPMVDTINILDVRKPGEYDAGHLPNGKLFSVDYIWDNLNQLDPNTKYHLHCKTGYRSTIAASILMQQGFNGIVNITGGIEAIEAAGIALDGSPCDA